MRLAKPHRTLWVNIIVLVSWLTLVGGTAEGTYIVVPDSLETFEGNTSNVFPFDPLSTFGMRYQQVFDFSQFGLLPLFLSQISFRPDGSSGTAFSTSIDNIQISLSTTSKAPDLLSNTFNENTGADETIVFSGLMALSSSFTGPPGGPKDFDIVINFSNSFLYDPNAGNLLLDVTNYTGPVSDISQLDAQGVEGDSISRLQIPNSGGTVGSLDTIGLVARFEANPVPEPASILLLASGLLGIGGWRRLYHHRGKTA